MMTSETDQEEHSPPSIHINSVTRHQPSGPIYKRSWDARSPATERGIPEYNAVEDKNCPYTQTRSFRQRYAQMHPNILLDRYFNAKKQEKRIWPDLLREYNNDSEIVYVDGDQQLPSLSVPSTPSTNKSTKSTGGKLEYWPKATVGFLDFMIPHSLQRGSSAPSSFDIAAILSRRSEKPGTPNGSTLGSARRDIHSANSSRSPKPPGTPTTTTTTSNKSISPPPTRKASAGIRLTPARANVGGDRVPPPPRGPPHGPPRRAMSATNQNRSWGQAPSTTSTNGGGGSSKFRQRKMLPTHTDPSTDGGVPRNGAPSRETYEQAFDNDTYETDENRPIRTLVEQPMTEEPMYDWSNIPSYGEAIPPEVTVSSPLSSEQYRDQPEEPGAPEVALNEPVAAFSSRDGVQDSVVIESPSSYAMEADLNSPSHPSPSPSQHHHQSFAPEYPDPSEPITPWETVSVSVEDSRAIIEGREPAPVEYEVNMTEDREPYGRDASLAPIAEGVEESEEYRERLGAAGLQRTYASSNLLEGEGISEGYTHLYGSETDQSPIQVQQEQDTGNGQGGGEQLVDDRSQIEQGAGDPSDEPSQRSDVRYEGVQNGFGQGEEYSSGVRSQLEPGVNDGGVNEGGQYLSDGMNDRSQMETGQYDDYGNVGAQNADAGVSHEQDGQVEGGEGTIVYSTQNERDREGYDEPEGKGGGGGEEKEEEEQKYEEEEFEDYGDDDFEEDTEEERNNRDGEENSAAKENVTTTSNDATADNLADLYEGTRRLDYDYEPTSDVVIAATATKSQPELYQEEEGKKDSSNSVTGTGNSLADVYEGTRRLDYDYEPNDGYSHEPQGEEGVVSQDIDRPVQHDYHGDTNATDEDDRQNEPDSPNDGPVKVVGSKLMNGGIIGDADHDRLKDDLDQQHFEHDTLEVSVAESDSSVNNRQRHKDEHW